MANDSSTGGYILPTSAPLVEGAGLGVVLQNLVVGVTGLPTNLVRPRWQTVAPVEPDINTDWCAVGVTDEQPEDGALCYRYDGAQMTSYDHVILTVTASFYGPNAVLNAQHLRIGLMIAQNREALYFDDISLVERAGPVVIVPAITNDRARLRADVSFRLSRTITTTWPIDPLAAAAFQVNTSDGHSQAGSTPSSINPLVE